MDIYQRLLYDGFPRDGARPTRFTLFNRHHFDYLVESVNQQFNVYASLARLPPSGPYCDKVTFDLDGEVPDEWEDKPRPEEFNLMREDPDIANAILGGVVDDMRQLAAAARADGVPAVGVFTGKGVHVHLLYQEVQHPKNEMNSTANKYNEELGLDTVDEAPIGDVMRIMKIPNTQRRKNGEPCCLWTVPLTHDEMCWMDAQTLLEVSTQPRTPVMDLPPRPEMQVYEDYLEQTGDVAPHRDVGARADVDDDLAGFFVEELIQLPCLRERVLSRRPHHHIRQNFAVWLFNLGLSVNEAHTIIRGLNWENYDPEETDRQLRQIWRGRYADWSCSKLKAKGHCTRLDDPYSCPTYGWHGGNQRYP